LRHGPGRVRQRRAAGAGRAAGGVARDDGGQRMKGEGGQRMTLDAKIPAGPLNEKWDAWLDAHRLVGPRNRAAKTVIVVGTGLAGASAAASLAAQGFAVKVFCFQDSSRRAHSIAAQGGIN